MPEETTALGMQQRVLRRTAGKYTEGGGAEGYTLSADRSRDPVEALHLHISQTVHLYGRHAHMNMNHHT